MSEKSKAKKKPSFIERTKNKQKVEAGATLLEELFRDMYMKRWHIYHVNFVRGIFFGFGSVIGGTILIAILIWVLSQFGALVPAASEFIQQVLDTLQRNSQ